MICIYVVIGVVFGIGVVIVELFCVQGYFVVGVDFVDMEVIGDLLMYDGCIVVVEVVVEVVDGSIDVVIVCVGIVVLIVKIMVINFFGVMEFFIVFLLMLSFVDQLCVVVVLLMVLLQLVLFEFVDVVFVGDEVKVLQIGDQFVVIFEVGFFNYLLSKCVVLCWVCCELVIEVWVGVGILFNVVVLGMVIIVMIVGLFVLFEGLVQVDVVVLMLFNYYQFVFFIVELLVWLMSFVNMYMVGQIIYCDGGVDVVFCGDDIWLWNDVLCS